MSQGTLFIFLTLVHVWCRQILLVLALQLPYPHLLHLLWYATTSALSCACKSAMMVICTNRPVVHKMTVAAQSVPYSSRLCDATYDSENGVCGHEVWLTLLITGCRYDGRGIDTQHQAGSCVLSILLLSIQFICWLYHHAAQHARLVVSCPLAPCSSAKLG